MPPREKFLAMAKDFKLDKEAARLLWWAATGTEIPHDVLTKALPGLEIRLDAPSPPEKTAADGKRFAIGDAVRLTSERRMMTVASFDCIEVCCQWMDGDTLCESHFHRDALTGDPYPDPLPL